MQIFDHDTIFHFFVYCQIRPYNIAGLAVSPLPLGISCITLRKWAIQLVKQIGTESILLCVYQNLQINPRI